MYKYVVELSFSKSATFTFRKFPFCVLKVALSQVKSCTFENRLLIC